ncbi:MAG: hypothetical protein IPF99_13720 [Deltaproteobacteria bacterium]|nr:hypothetical protein [Deltaproteobacteria bacterium]
MSSVRKVAKLWVDDLEAVAALEAISLKLACSPGAGRRGRGRGVPAR